MSENQEEVKNSVDVPYETVSKETLETYANQMQAMQKALTPPEGKKLLGIRAVCPIHGDITNACKFMPHTKYAKDPEGKVVAMVGSDIICLECVADIWRKYVHEHYPKDENGNVQVIKVAPVFGEEKAESKEGEERETGFKGTDGPTVSG